MEKRSFLQQNAVRAYCLWIITALCLTACNSRETDTFAKEKRPSYPQDTLTDFIKSHSLPRERFANLVKIDWEQKPALKAEHIVHLFGRYRSNSNNDTLFADSGRLFVPFDFAEIGDKLLFSIASYDSLTNAADLYHFSFDRNNRMLYGCTKIGSSMEHKGTERTARLSYAKDGLSLIVNTKSAYETSGSYPHKLTTDKSSTRYDFEEDKTTFRLLHKADDETMIERAGD
jgi:hypothetical protein